MKMDMMKKEYIAPSIEVVEMEPIFMFAGTSITDGSQLGGTGGTGGDPDVEPDGELSNRRRNYWNEVGSGW